MVVDEIIIVIYLKISSLDIKLKLKSNESKSKNLVLLKNNDNKVRREGTETSKRNIDGQTGTALPHGLNYVMSDLLGWLQAVLNGKKIK